MMPMRQVRRAVCLVAAVLSGSLGACAQAAGSPARTSGGLTECLGYYTVALSGEFEYALMSNFSQGLGAWSSEIRLDLLGLQAQELSISRLATAAELEALMRAMNGKREKEIDELKSNLSETDRPSLRKIYSDQLADLHLFAPVAGHNAVSRIEKDKLAVHALVDNHILSTELKPEGTPKQTLDAFLGHYKPRALGEVPAGPGVCVPFGVFTGEKQPATVGLNIRLKDQPDIVVFLLARDAANDSPEDPREFIERKTDPMTMFYGSRGATAMDKFRPARQVTIDGQPGLGVFVNVKRDATLLQSVHNPATGNIDWGYLAYIPGLSGGKPGDSFNLTFKVERFGRFATRPMSESEFRELTLRIAASIKRRPGAWVRN